MEIVPNGSSFSTSGPGEVRYPVFHIKKQHEIEPETCPDQYFCPQGLCQELDDWGYNPPRGRADPLPIPKLWETLHMLV